MKQLEIFVKDIIGKSIISEIADKYSSKIWIPIWDPQK